MKLLIVTQAVDVNDPILGFFCGWLTEFAKKFETIEVICLTEGKHSLPANVHVHSLGKERAANTRLLYVARFGRLIWSLRYDSVLVHMNPEYVILGSLDWLVMRKPVSLWYNHPANNLRLQIAVLFARKIFFTSPYAATAHSSKSVQMPVGIDTNLFSPVKTTRDRKSLYIQGRITRSKRVHILLEALRIVRTKIPATLTLVGPEEERYAAELRTQFADLVSVGAVDFAGPRTNEETPVLYGAHGLAVNLAAAGHFDKSALEAMACGTPAIVASPAFKGLIPQEWIIAEASPKALAEAILGLIGVPEGPYEELGRQERQAVAQTHSLERLGQELAKELGAVYSS